jgi:hypothetical protein
VDLKLSPAGLVGAPGRATGVETWLRPAPHPDVCVGLAVVGMRASLRRRLSGNRRTDVAGVAT